MRSYSSIQIFMYINFDEFYFPVGEIGKNKLYIINYLKESKYWIQVNGKLKRILKRIKIEIENPSTLPRTNFQIKKTNRMNIDFIES